MKTILIFTAVLLMALPSMSQTTDTDSLSKAELSKLAFMTGTWKGTGWMMGQNGARSEFEQREDIQFKLDSTLLVVEGTGSAGGRVVHNAYAILTWNKNEDRYSFRSYLQNGQSGDFPAELLDGKLYWYPNASVRYVAWTNENGQWVEKGEYRRGDNWMQFFEMTLERE